MRKHIEHRMRRFLGRLAMKSYHSVSEKLVGAFPAAVVMYHSISATGSNNYTVTPSVFARQIRFLKHNFAIARLRSIANVTIERSRRPYVALTFDDAYVNFIENAYPVLKELEVPATVFVPTGLIGRTNEWDTDQNLPQRQLMNREQLCTLLREGLVDVGSHTVTHSSMLALSPERMRFEAQESKKTLEEFLDTHIEMFAYPYGRYDNFSAETTRVLRETGYDLAVTTVWGTRQSSRNLMTLRRISFRDSDGCDEIRRKVIGEYDLRGIRQWTGHLLRAIGLLQCKSLAFDVDFQLYSAAFTPTRQANSL